MECFIINTSDLDENLDRQPTLVFLLYPTRKRQPAQIEHQHFRDERTTRCPFVVAARQGILDGDNPIVSIRPTQAGPLDVKLESGHFSMTGPSSKMSL